MRNEIERKFFVKQLPSLEGIEPIYYERYILSNENGKEIRVQKLGNSYVYEEKIDVSGLERARTKKEISKEKFDELRIKSNNKAIIRDRYNISSNPDISIQIYKGDFDGLIRAEVEFENEHDAQKFEPSPWMGAEMTGLPIARDANLVGLSRSDFENYLGNRF